MRATLESVKWADEIFVVDSYSTDETIDVCYSYGARIVQHEYVNSAKQKNWAVPQCQGEWVLQMDSDEVLEKGLREEIEQAIESIASDVHAFRIPRKNFFLGRWLRHGGNYPDYQTRLFRRDEGRWMDREVHAHVKVSGAIGTLHYALLHDDTPNLSKPLKNLDRYTRYEADELTKRGVHYRWYDLLLRPWAAFFYHFFWLAGFRDGWRGFLSSVYAGIYVFLVRAKLWEMETLRLTTSPK